jgi:3-oxoacyl-[acyl-carrier protein] reductase
MDYGLKGRNVLVTGSTSGVGAAIVRVLAGEGANVIISGKNRERAENLAKEITETYGVRAVPLITNLSERGEAEKLFARSIEALGSLDVLINNAGVWLTAYVTEMELSDFDDTLYLNLEVPFLLSKRMVNHLLAEGRKGKIINIVSQAAFHGASTGHAHYAASKAGLVGFTISLAREVAPKGINVNAVAPGMVYTKMVSAAVDAKRDYYEGRIPLGRVAMPEEVAYPVVFLASDKSDYMTGATLDVSGGMLMR